MDETISNQPRLETASDYEAAVGQCLAEMERLNEQIMARPSK
jgi:hypothetical protein